MNALSIPSTALDIAAGVRARSVSAVEITRRYLDRIEKLDRDIHAFQLVRSDKALAEAEVVDRRDDLAQLPLAGVPVAVKDNFNVAGEPTRIGSAATPSTLVQADDEVVRRLRRAGAIVIGKTTLPELAIFGFTESAAFGVTRNPWNRERSPGGSTGGGAAAVAAGMSPLALGTDGLGSIRIPSNFCGLFGLKPSRGRVPLMGDMTEHWSGLSVVGPIATTVGDAALMLDVLAGSAIYRDVRPPNRQLRIALSLKPPTFLAKLDPLIARVVTDSAAALRDAGHHVSDADPPYPLTLGNDVLRIWMAGVAEDARSLDWNALEKRTRTMARMGRRLGPGSPVPMSAWTAKASSWFRDYDVALMPAVAVQSIPAGGYTGRGMVSTVWSQVKALPYTGAWSIAGFPAAAVPAGLGPDGVPIAVQIVAPAGAEALILSVAAQLEQLRPWQRLASV